MQTVRYTVGLLTLLAALVGGYWLFDLFTAADPADLYSVRIEFRETHGLRPGAVVRYRGVRVGSVRDVEVSQQGDRTLVLVALAERAVHLARQQSQFWIVTPRFGGFTGEISGLDTLIKEPYVSFLTSDLHDAELPSGSLVVGEERPPSADPTQVLPALRAGDLSMTLLVSQRRGIQPGAEVRYRGLRVGEVRSINLAEDPESGEDYLEVGLRIEGRYRRTVREKDSLFWVARPRVSGAILSGMALEDLTAAIDPYVSYRNSSAAAGAPAHDGWRTIASEVAPDVEEDSVPKTALVPPRTTDHVLENDSSRELRGYVLVEVAYQAVEVDWISANDQISARGRGILFVDTIGRTVVLTARSACDGKYIATDLFGSTTIRQENLRVTLPDKSVVRAGRQWVDPDGADLALLVLERAVGGELDGGTAKSVFDFESKPTEQNVIRIPDAGANYLETLVLNSSEASPPRDRRGSILVNEERRIVGLLGQRSGTDVLATIVPIGRVPDDLRPRMQPK